MSNNTYPVTEDVLSIYVASLLKFKVDSKFSAYIRLFVWNSMRACDFA